MEVTQRKISDETVPTGDTGPTKFPFGAGFCHMPYLSEENSNRLEWGREAYA
jgi:hypothetical protein